MDSFELGLASCELFEPNLLSLLAGEVYNFGAAYTLVGDILVTDGLEEGPRLVP